MEEGDISVLPEECISTIISFTSPQDTCSSSLISSTFKSAAECDAAWEKFLLKDYRDIAMRAVPLLDLSSFGSKKELYLRLCDEPLLIDGGNKSLHLEKASGKKCFMLGARELYILWSDTPQHWRWTPCKLSRFAEVARLMNVRWLLIEGTIHTRVLSPKTTYVVYLVVRFLEDASGLDDPPAEVTVKFAGGSGIASETRLVKLDPIRRQLTRRFVPLPRIGFMRAVYGKMVVSEVQTRNEDEFHHLRGDGWMEVEMGEFYNDDGEDGEVEVSVAETKSGQCKSGLIVQGIEMRPKRFGS